MFGQMMDAIDDDYLRYVMHVQVVAEPAPEPDLSRASYQAAEDPVQGASLLEALRSSIAPAEVAAAGGASPPASTWAGCPWRGARPRPGTRPTRRPRHPW